MINARKIKAAQSSSCLVCEAQGKDVELYPGIRRCSECRYVYADVQLTDEELSAIYGEQFFTGAEFSDYLSAEPLFRKNFRSRWKVLTKFLDAQRHRNLLEIGSGYGFFLDEVEDKFDSVEGIDITDAGVRYAQEHLGLHVVQGDFLKRNYGEQQFDVVCMWDTIEHLRAPEEYVEKISDLTSSGALLAITTADVESLNSRMRGRRWRMIHPPTHLHYFSPGTIERLLGRYGFEVIYNRYCGFYRSIGNVAHSILVQRHKQEAIYRKIEGTRVATLGFYLNLYDIMYVIARRR